MCWHIKERSLVANVGRCSWGKCIFCGWGKKEGKGSVNELIEKIKSTLRRPPKRLKIYTSGSIFDEKQFPRHFQLWLAEALDRTCVKELQLESLPEFISYERIQPLLNRSYKLIVALGLEVADDEALKALGKYPAMSVSKYIAACTFLRSLGVKVKTYVLANPPVEGWLEKFHKTMKIALNYSDEIVIINTYPHSESPLFLKWVKGEWTPLTREEFMEIVKPYLKYHGVELEFSNFVFRPRFPKYLRKKIVGANKDTLLHPYYNVWQEYLSKFYTPPTRKKFLLFVPCSYKKPYFRSKTWKAILNVLRREGLRRKVHVVAVSSPGVVPEEFTDEYPFNSYDWPEWEETTDIKRLYIDVTKRRVKNYLLVHKHHYEKILIYLKPESESFKAVMEACREARIECISCLSEEVYEEVKEYKPAVIHPKALKALSDCLKRVIR
jgi:hypothetical protein